MKRTAENIYKRKDSRFEGREFDNTVMGEEGKRCLDCQLR